MIPTSLRMGLAVSQFNTEDFLIQGERRAIKIFMWSIDAGGDVYCHGMRALTLSLVSLLLSQVYFLFLSRFVFILAFLCPGTFIYLPSHADLGRSTLNWPPVI